MKSLSETLKERLEEADRQADELEELRKKVCSLTIWRKCIRCGRERQESSEEYWEVKKREIELYGKSAVSAIEFDLEWLTSGGKLSGVCGECRAELRAKRLLPPKCCKLKLYPERQKMLDELWDKNLFLTGPNGIGKTVFACAVAKRWLAETQREIRFVSYPSFILKLQSSCTAGGEDAYHMAEGIATFGGLLIIDDLGAEHLTGFVRQATYYIINHREQYELPIVITSNFSLVEVATQIDKRIFSRIAGMCEVIGLKGGDLRLKK